MYEKSLLHEISAEKKFPGKEFSMKKFPRNSKCTRNQPLKSHSFMKKFPVKKIVRKSTPGRNFLSSGQNFQTSNKKKYFARTFQSWKAKLHHRMHSSPAPLPPPIKMVLIYIYTLHSKKKYLSTEMSPLTWILFSERKAGTARWAFFRGSCKI
jgi:hypothetical protein